MITKFENYINESIKNPTYVKSELRKMLIEIQKITPTLKKSNLRFEDYSKMKYFIELRNLDIKSKSKINSLLKNKQNEFLKVGVLLIYKCSETPILNFLPDSFDFEPSGEYDLTYRIYVKDLYTKRFAPPRYLYHVSYKSNRESIMKYGLKLGSFENSKWSKESIEYYYPPAVFANIDFFSWYNRIGKGKADVWRIDTKGLKNIWWEDLNFYRHLDPMKKPVECVMTFEPIPPEHIKLTKS